MLARRSMLEILYEILRCDNGKKTHIMYEVALTHAQTQAYLDLLVERELMRPDYDEGDRLRYAVTPKGRKLVEHLEVVLSYLGLGDYDA